MVGLLWLLQVKKMEDSAAGEEEERTVSIISSLLLNIAKQVGARAGMPRAAPLHALLI